jgi:hypothetical protein
VATKLGVILTSTESDNREEITSTLFSRARLLSWESAKLGLWKREFVEVKIWSATGFGLNPSSIKINTLAFYLRKPRDLPGMLNED